MVLRLIRPVISLRKADTQRPHLLRREWPMMTALRMIFRFEVQNLKNAHQAIGHDA
jgi:hypothetical protein